MVRVFFMGISFSEWIVMFMRYYTTYIHVCQGIRANICRGGAFRIEPPRERGRLIASPTTNAILRRGGLSPPETKKQHPPKAGAVIFSNIRLKISAWSFSNTV
jgi:hypothetical protein